MYNTPLTTLPLLLSYFFFIFFQVKIYILMLFLLLFIRPVFILMFCSMTLLCSQITHHSTLLHTLISNIYSCTIQPPITYVSLTYALSTLRILHLLPCSLAWTRWGSLELIWPTVFGQLWAHHAGVWLAPLFYLSHPFLQPLG